MRNRAKFVLIGLTIPEIWPYFDFSRWRPSDILIVKPVWSQMCVSVPNFVPISQTVCRFSRWRPSAILDLTKFEFLATWLVVRASFFLSRRQLTTNIILYGICSFHFYRWNQFKVIPLACLHSIQSTLTLTPP